MFEIEKKSQKEQEFWNLLVYIVTGQNLCQLSKGDQKKLLNQIRDLFLNYLVEFTRTKYSQAKSLELQTHLKNPENLFSSRSFLVIITESIQSFAHNLNLSLSDFEPVLER